MDKSPVAIKAYLMRCINSGRDYDAPPSYGSSKDEEVTPKTMTNILQAAIDREGGSLPMRAESFLISEHGFLMRCSKTNGRMEPLAVVAGEMLAVLYARWIDQGNLT